MSFSAAVRMQNLTAFQVQKSLLHKLPCHFPEWSSPKLKNTQPDWRRASSRSWAIIPVAGVAFSDFATTLSYALSARPFFRKLENERETTIFSAVFNFAMSVLVESYCLIDIGLRSLGNFRSRS